MIMLTYVDSLLKDHTLLTVPIRLHISLELNKAKNTYNQQDTSTKATC